MLILVILLDVNVLLLQPPGTVPANGQLDIVITYAPTAFITAVMKIQLEIQQFFSKPFVCTITGYSTPGLTAE